MNFMYSEAPKNWALSVWADSWGVWQGRVNFLTPLGNTPEAEKIKANGLRAIKRAIRKELLTRELIRPNRRINWQLIKNQTELGTGRLVSLTIEEEYKGYTPNA